MRLFGCPAASWAQGFAQSDNQDYNLPRAGFLIAAPGLPLRTRPYTATGQKSFEILDKFLANRMKKQAKHLYVFGRFSFDPEERLL